jgi:hypothetical protein
MNRKGKTRPIILAVSQINGEHHLQQHHRVAMLLLTKAKPVALTEEMK